MDGWHGAQTSRSQPDREQLAKEWLLRLIERTPLNELGELPVAWIVNEAPALIAEILGRLGVDDPDRQTGSVEARLADGLRRLRNGPDAAEKIPRDLAMLHSLLVETLEGGAPRPRRGDFPRAAERLANVFGEINGAVNRSLRDQRATEGELGVSKQDARLREWIRSLLAEQQRYGYGFGIALVDVDGLAQINEAYGRAAGDRVVAAVGDVIRKQVRASDQAFRYEEDEFVILAPHSGVAELLALGRRISDLIEDSQAADGARIGVAIGVAACPDDGDTEERLIESATAAVYAAKAGGRPIATNPGVAPTPLQDR